MGLTAEQRLQWWHEARFGMFIHWGLYASLAGEYNGEKIGGIGEWIMRNAKIPIPEYEKLADDFNPVKFDAEQWAQLAQDAGMKYLVITAKHHDGFCMFDSPSNPYNIVNRTPFKRDPMKELAEACNKRGIRMCFYYSQALDWHAEGGAGHWDEVGEGDNWLAYARPAEDFQKYLDDVVKPNLRELLTHYGPIGLIWFDTPVAITPQQSADLRDLVHELQPECLVSGRVGHDVGDYGSLGDNEHPAGHVSGAWETPATLNDTWGYKKDDHNWKSLDELLGLLVNCASKGVNYLLNVGPTDEGVIPQPSADLLRQIGQWLDRNGEAIYGTTASPFPVDPDWGRVTRKGNTLYLLVKKWTPQIRLPGLKNNITAARILGADDEVTCVNDGDFTTINLPQAGPEELVSVVALELDGEPNVEQIIIQDGASPVNLPMHMSQLEGKVNLRKNGVTQHWTATDNSATWTFRATTPGAYDLTAITLGRKVNPQHFGNHDIEVAVADSVASGTVGVKDMDMDDDAPWLQYPRSPIGKLTIPTAGEVTVTVRATRIDETAQMGLRMIGLELSPA